MDRACGVINRRTRLRPATECARRPTLTHLVRCSRRGQTRRRRYSDRTELCNEDRHRQISRYGTSPSARQFAPRRRSIRCRGKQSSQAGSNRRPEVQRVVHHNNALHHIEPATNKRRAIICVGKALAAASTSIDEGLAWTRKNKCS
jgi:hypothetical protein